MQVVAATGTLNTVPGSVVRVRDPRLAKPWKISERAITSMGLWESGILNGMVKGMQVRDGFILPVYDDGFGIPTVGLGHVVTPQDNLSLGDKITVERGRELLLKDLSSAEGALNKGVNVPLYQHEYDALVICVFNIGIGAFASSTMRKTLNAGLYGEVSAQMARYVYAKNERTKKSEIVAGLVKRRKREAAMFDEATYGGSE